MDIPKTLPWSELYGLIIDKHGDNVEVEVEWEYIITAANILPKFIEIARHIDNGNFNQAHLIEKARRALSEIDKS